jgi:hypothetical protein
MKYKFIAAVALSSISFSTYSLENEAIPDCMSTIDWCPMDSACRIKTIDHQGNKVIGHQANIVKVTSKDGKKSVVCIEDKDITEDIDGHIVYNADGSIFIEIDKTDTTTPSKAEFEKVLRMED